MEKVIDTICWQLWWRSGAGKELVLRNSRPRSGEIPTPVHLTASSSPGWEDLKPRVLGLGPQAGEEAGGGGGEGGQEGGEHHVWGEKLQDQMVAALFLFWIEKRKIVIVMCQHYPGLGRDLRPDWVDFNNNSPLSIFKTAELEGKVLPSLSEYLGVRNSAKTHIPVSWPILKWNSQVLQ